MPRNLVPALALATALSAAVPLFAADVENLKLTPLSASTRSFDITGNLTNYDALQTGRLVRTGDGSTCAVPTTCAAQDTTPRRYRPYLFQNLTGGTACYRIHATASCGTNLQVAVYLGSFDPANVCNAAYLADVGGTNTNRNFSFKVPAGATFTVVVNEVTAGTGCSGYTLGVITETKKGDFNLDRNSDLVWRNQSTGNNALWLMNGTSFSSIMNLPALPDNTYFIAAVSDFDGDGIPDILLHQQTGLFSNAIWLMNADGTLKSTVNLPKIDDGCWYLRGAGDFDGDGWQDIVLHNLCTGAGAIWLMNGTSYSATVNLPFLPSGYRYYGVGDFNGDGMPDILVRNSSTGANAAWLMNGTAYSTTMNLPALPNGCFEPDGIDDYNADGTDDIVWRNTCTGANAIWLMNPDATLSSIVNLPALPDTNYALSGPR